MEKHIKFLTIREAIREIIDSLLRTDCVEEIAEIRNGCHIIACPPEIEYITTIWYI